MKKIISKIFLGFCIGLTIGVFCGLLSSYFHGSDMYYATVPSFYNKFSTNLEATSVAIILFGIFGAISSLLSYIYESKHIKTLLAKTLIHALCLYSLYLIIMYIMDILMYYSLVLSSILWFLIYFLIWISTWFLTKHEVNSINKKLKNR